MVPRLEQALAVLRKPAFDITFRGFGFFPTAKSARVFWIGIQSGAGLTHLASAIDDVTATFDVTCAPGDETPCTVPPGEFHAVTVTVVTG